MVICYVLGCKSLSKRKCENITFHTFPKDSTIWQLWVRATGRENWVPSKYAKICSKHFEQKCFRKAPHNVYLEVFSVPTLHIPAKQSQMRCQDSPKCPVSEYASIFAREEVDTESGQRLDIMAIPSTSSAEMQIDRNPMLDIMAIPSTSSAAMQIDRNPMDTVTSRKRKLLKKLDRQTLAQSRKKKLAIIRSRNHRLLKRNAELSAVIQKLQEKRLINQDTADLLTTVHTDRCKDPLHYLIQECLKKCIGLNLFSQDHDFTDQSIFDNYYSLLIKAICKKYLNVRIHYATKSLCNKGENIRNFYTKLI